MAKERREDEPTPGAPDWIVTFSDMISLLVTFFILLMTFSSLEAHDVFKVQGNITGRRGVIQNLSGKTAIEPPDVDLMAATDGERGAAHPHSRPTEELAESLEEMGQKKTDEHLEVDLRDVVDGLVVHFDERGSFAPGSIEVSPSLRTSLMELAETMSHYPHLVVVEGFTDSAFKPTLRYPTAEALAVGRATAAAQVMLEHSGLTPKRLQIAGLGAARPVAPNDSASGRRRNRRVEVRILALSKTRQAVLDDLRGR